jgi:hypothetical protein
VIDQRRLGLVVAVVPDHRRGQHDGVIAGFDPPRHPADDASQLVEQRGSSSTMATSISYRIDRANSDKELCGRNAIAAPGVLV